MDAKVALPPQVTLKQISARRIGTSGHWDIAWGVKNIAPDPIKVLTVRLPHGQFKSEELRFEPAIDLSAKQEKNFQLPVRCDEPQGLVTENAFVIFHVEWRGAPWRIFVRVRVAVNEKGEPSATTELITTQEVGFTGVNG